MENLQINEGIKFLVGDGKGVIGTADPSGSQGISKTAGHTGFYIMSSVNYTLYFYDGSAWAAHQSIDVSDANYIKGFAFAWEDNTAAYIKTADSSHRVDVFARNTDLKVDSTPGDATQGADSIVDGTGSLSITSINAQNYYTEALSVDNSGTVTFDRTDNNSAYQLKFSGTNITIGNNGSDTITLTGGDEFTSPLTTDGDLFIQDGSADSRLGIGSDGQYLSVSSGSPAWVDLSASPWSTYTSPDDYVEFTLGGVSIGGGNTYTAGGEPYRDGVLVVGKTNTLNKVQRGLVVGYDNQMGKNNYSSAGSMFGMSNIIYDGTANHVMGASNYAGYGNYNHAFGYQNRVYGDNNIALGRANHAGNSSANVEDTVTIGFSNKAMSDKQIIIGHSVQTNSTNTTEEGIYFGLSGQHNMVIMRETGVTGKPANLTFGGFNNGTYLGTGNSGAGSGIFYLSNSQYGYTIEPTSDMPDSVGMWAKDRASGKKGMILKSENGGMSWIGDRIGVNVTSNGTSTHNLTSTIDASLHVFGEGKTSGTSSFKIDNSDGNTLFEVKDDGTVQANGGSLLGMTGTFGLEINTSTQTSATYTNSITGTWTYGSIAVGYGHKLDGGGRNSTFIGNGSNIDVYADNCHVIGAGNKALGATYGDSFRHNIMMGYYNDMNGRGNYMMAYSSDCYGVDNVAGGNVVIGHTNINGKTDDASTNVYMIGKNLMAEGNSENQMILGFGNKTSLIDNTAPIITFGTSTYVQTRPSIAMFGDPGESNQATNLVIGGDAGRAGTSHTYQDGIGSACLIFADNSYYTKAPSVNVPNAVSLYIGDRSYDGNNATVGGKGLIIKGENSGRTYISERVGINVSHNSAKNSQINEDVEAGLHIYGEGNSDTTSALKAENSDGDVLIEVKNNGVINVSNLPTSSAGLSTGDLYNDGGILKIA